MGRRFAARGRGRHAADDSVAPLARIAVRGWPRSAELFGERLRLSPAVWLTFNTAAPRRPIAVNPP